MSDAPKQTDAEAIRPNPDETAASFVPVATDAPLPEATPAAPVETTTEQSGAEAPTAEAAAARTESLPGKVIRVTPEQVFVELQDARQGTVPLIEFVGQPLPKVGDEVKVIIERDDAETGLLALSKRQADELTFWESVQPGDLLEGVVTGMNKGGLDIDIGGARAFLPASQVDVRRLKDISTLIGEHVRCVVSQVDRTTRDLIVSRRKYIERERKQKRVEALNALVEGEVRTGTVCNLAEFGAFVDVGGVEGLVHITDLSWGRVRTPADVVQPGQQVQVRVLKVDHQTHKVSLGMKQIVPNPWESAATRYTEGSRITAKVARLAEFGAFLELEPGIDALLPVSEMSWARRVNHPGDVVKVGDELEVVVLKVDAAKRRISVGRKQAEENPWTTVQTQYPPNSTVRGKVSKIMDYGAFIELPSGLEGLIHISEVSEKRIKAVSDVLKPGQEVEVRVLKIDPEAQRISLSMRPARKEAPAAVGDDKGKKKPQKKRPVRGGLSSHFEW